MSGSKKIILRVQSSEGTKRLEVFDGDPTASLFEKVYEAFLLSNFGFALYRDKGRKDEIFSSKSKLLSELKLNNGDMLYLSPVNGAVLFDQPSTSDENSSKAIYSETPQQTESILPTTTIDTANLKEDPVDLELYKYDGKIQRARDNKLCRHNSNGCCVHCTPIEPWDEAYLKELNIKHLSFHSYIRKLMSGVDRGKFLSLETPTFKIKPGCKEHSPWPKGICSKCQPSAVTLNRQAYRHVDNIMFENRQIVERFLSYWRATGNQRVGILYGCYEKHPDVPLGIRARVAAIYEPAQTSTRDSVTMLPDDKMEVVDEITSKLGLTQVGWIFTDLLSEDVTKGTVQHLRGIDSHFLSAQECIMAGYFQNQHPNVCRYAGTNYFGSKFVTVCVTGDESKQVHMEGYQVSEQCAALVRDDCLLPTKDAPELGYVRPTSTRQYVPDVFYKEKDQYGNEVQAVARPLPVAYLLVDVPAGLGQGYETFSANAKFPPAHRPISGHVQFLKPLLDHINESSCFLEVLSDLHVLVYIATNDALSIKVNQLEPALNAVLNKDKDAAERWRNTCEAWGTLQELMSASLEDYHANSDNMDTDGAPWTCPHCTFHNPSHRTTCEICVLPRDNSM